MSENPIYRLFVYRKKAAIGSRNRPIPRNGRLSASEIRKALPIGDSNRRRKNPIVIMQNVKKNKRASTEMKVPISLPDFVNIPFAGWRMVLGK